MALCKLHLLFSNDEIPLGTYLYMGKPEIPVGKSNGSRHSVWKVLEKMGSDLRRTSFQLLLVCLIDMNLFCRGSYSYLVKFYRFMLVHKISTRVVCVQW